MSGAETATANELAEASKKTRQWVNQMATKEQWPHRIVNDRGDREFYVDQLPEQYRVAWYSKKTAPLPAVSTLSLYNRYAPATANRSLPAVADNHGKPLQNWQVDKGAAWADLVRLYVEHVARAKDKPGVAICSIKKDFAAAYNAGAYPYLYSILGKTSWKTLERKRHMALSPNADPIHALAPRHGGRRGERAVTDEQMQVLFSIVRSPYQSKRISEVIRVARTIMGQRGIQDGLSDATYRRFLQDWVSKNYAEFTFWRGGEKALNDQCGYWLERDYSKIEVGDVLVADGHPLNFEILNPWTGKAKRMTMILWYDMKSNYPLGWEIMPREDTQAINAALRRAILRLGKFPKVVYLDNGRAFKSRFFTNTDVDFEQAGFTGLWQRLDLRPIYAWPYHAQSKTVERFFGTFGELERLSPSYTGTSIEEKPPRLNRGEKLHRRIHEKITCGYVPTLEEAHRAVASWFDVYGRRPQGGHLDGQSPSEVFEPGRGPGVDAAMLRELMMSMEIRKVYGRGIKLFGFWYYDPALYGRKHKVIVRYDLQDKSSIFVYDEENRLLCEARQAPKVHPAAGLLGTDEDRELLASEIALKKSLEKETLKTARAFMDATVIPEVRAQIAQSGFDPETTAGNGRTAVTKPQKIVALPLTEAEKARIEKEFRQAEEDHASSARSVWDEIQASPDLDRYEKLLEMEAQGLLIPKDAQAFMRYFEETAQYRKLEDYFDELRAKTAMMYQTDQGS